MGLTQAQLAQCLEATDKVVSKWECGKKPVDITLLDRLAADSLADNLSKKHTAVIWMMYLFGRRESLRLMSPIHGIEMVIT